MNNNSIKEILKTKSMLFTREEIEALMNDELEKDVDEMDTEIVDLCLEALTGEKLSEKEGVAEKETNSTPPAIKPIRKNKTIKIILVAAILISLLLLTVSVGADVMNIDVSDKTLKINNSFYKVDLNGDVDSTDLKTVLYENELENLVLPKCLYDGFEISGFEKVKEDDKNRTKIFFNFTDSKNDLTGGVSCYIYKTNFNFTDGEQKINNENKSVKEINQNGMKILVFSNESNSTITYNNNNIEYTILLLDPDFDKAISFAETV